MWITLFNLHTVHVCEYPNGMIIKLFWLIRNFRMNDDGVANRLLSFWVYGGNVLLQSPIHNVEATNTHNEHIEPVCLCNRKESKRTGDG